MRCVFCLTPFALVTCLVSAGSVLGPGSLVFCQLARRRAVSVAWGGRAEVGECGQQVVVRFEAGRRDLAVAQPGKALAVDVIGEDAAVGVGGGLGAVVVQDVGQYLQGRRLGRLG